MTFLSRETLEKIASEIFEIGEIKYSANSYVLSLGQQAASSSISGEIKELDANRKIVIEAGQVAQLLTRERIRIPNRYMGFISLEPKVKFKGLKDVSGFHVSPGYTGKLLFVVSNESTNNIVLQENDSIFRMWLVKLDQETAHISNTKAFDSIPSDILSSLSTYRPNVFALENRIIELERRLNVYSGVIKWTAVTVATAAVGYFLSNILAEIITVDQRMNAPVEQTSPSAAQTNPPEKIDSDISVRPLHNQSY